MQGRQLRLLISLSTDRYGYYKCTLYNGKKHTVKVHRLVAEAFIDNPLNKKLVNHKDSNRKNNCVANLEWVDYYENNRHAVEHGNHNLNYFVMQRKGEEIVAIYMSSREASRITGVCQSSIVKACLGKKRKSAGGFIWNYV